MKKDAKKGPRPFLKWVGGKTQLLSELFSRLPHDFATNVRVYAEPFVGGGAFLFHLLAQGVCAERLVINDSNPDLVNAWRVVQRHVDYLVESLSRFETDYRALTGEAAKRSFYLGVRCAFNAGSANANSIDVARAAELIFLNKTCFNGLYRVNARGIFNVPFGKYANPSICDESAIRAASAALEGAEIQCADFAEAVKCADSGWFVYFDPPYRPISLTSAFCDYTQGGFGDEEQRRLADVCKTLDESGARWLLSNSDQPDGFFDELYRGFRIDRVRAARSINSKGDGRGKVSEIIVSNVKERG